MTHRKMSLTRLIEVPEVEMQVSKLVNSMLNLCQGYRQLEMKCMSDDVNLPTFGRMFELIRQLEHRRVEELIRFQVCRGQKITWFDLKPVEKLDCIKPVNLFQTILTLEKEIHKLTTKLDSLAWEKSDFALNSYLRTRVILRQVKVIRKRSNQLRNLKRSEDDKIPFLTARLTGRFEVEKLERELQMERTRREWRIENDYEREHLKSIGSTYRF
uniref:ferroxidase n=1 Tax=Schmidtea mediterranea TaxID=79327 RepID=A0AA51NIH1_SCHMD|nr:ferritin A [Schmidtea mediterranea]